METPKFGIDLSLVKTAFLPDVRVLRDRDQDHPKRGSAMEASHSAGLSQFAKPFKGLFNVRHGHHFGLSGNARPSSHGARMSSTVVLLITSAPSVPLKPKHPPLLIGSRRFRWMCDRPRHGIYQRRHAIDLLPRLLLIELDVAGGILAGHGVARMLAQDRMTAVTDLAGRDQLVQRLGGIGEGQIALADVLHWEPI
jgi:hypothetical protein